MNQDSFIPLTAIDCLIPALMIDRNAPVDVLHANAAARVRAATQLMETLSNRDLELADTVDLRQIATVAMMLLRDGWDWRDVLGWRLRVE